MAIKASIGFSQNPSAALAAKEAADQAKNNLGEPRIDLAFLFNTTNYDPAEILPVAFEALDETKLIGSSTAGILFEDKIKYLVK